MTKLIEMVLREVDERAINTFSIISHHLNFLTFEQKNVKKELSHKQLHFVHHIERVVSLVDSR